VLKNACPEPRRRDVPAALALIGLIAGLAIGPALVNPIVAMVGLALVSPRLGRCTLFAAIGILLSLHHAKLPAFDDGRFTIIEAPIEHDWRQRGDSFALLSSRFVANGVEVNAPIAIYARFPPQPIAMEKYVRAEAFVRLNEHDEYIASVKAQPLLTYEATLSRWHPAAWNRILANRLHPHVRAHPLEVALAEALVLGRGELLDDALRDSYRRGGTYHLLVFSGLQIAFAAAVLALLLRWLHKPRAADWLLLVFSILAPLFIGPTSSVSRASIGIGLYALSRICKRPTSLQNLWCVAAIARLLIAPHDLTDAAFHLTYAGAGALLFIGNHFSKRRWLASIIAAETVMTPLTLFHFHQFALGGALLTLIMSPLIFAMLIVSALACAFPCNALFSCIGALHSACAFLNQYGLSGFFTKPPLIALVIGTALSLIAVALLRERRRAFAIVIAMLIPSIAAILAFRHAHRVDHPRVTFLDVGQGDSIVIRSGTHNVLVDGGPSRHVLSLLADRGIRQLDAAILTHADLDHCEGLVEVIQHLDVRSVWISPRSFLGDCAVHLLEVTRVPIHLTRDGDTLSLNDVRITALVTDHQFRRHRLNNASTVLRVDIGKRRVLLTADIEHETEIVLDDRDLRADVLKVAHHGSKTSTSPNFLDLVAPRIAIISCGRRNLFGHPHPSTLRTLAGANVRTWRTDRDGTIDVDVRDARLYVSARTD
jgi:competence protein ComEC